MTDQKQEEHIVNNSSKVELDELDEDMEKDIEELVEKEGDTFGRDLPLMVDSDEVMERVAKSAKESIEHVLVLDLGYIFEPSDFEHPSEWPEDILFDSFLQAMDSTYLDPDHPSDVYRTERCSSLFSRGGTPDLNKAIEEYIHFFEDEEADHLKINSCRLIAWCVHRSKIRSSRVSEERVRELYIKALDQIGSIANQYLEGWEDHLDRQGDDSYDDSTILDTNVEPFSNISDEDCFESVRDRDLSPNIEASNDLCCYYENEHNPTSSPEYASDSFSDNLQEIEASEQEDQQSEEGEKDTGDEVALDQEDSSETHTDGQEEGNQEEGNQEENNPNTPFSLSFDTDTLLSLLVEHTKLGTFNDGECSVQSIESVDIEDGELDMTFLYGRDSEGSQEESSNRASIDEGPGIENYHTQLNALEADLEKIGESEYDTDELKDFLWSDSDMEDKKSVVNRFVSKSDDGGEEGSKFDYTHHTELGPKSTYLGRLMEKLALLFPRLGDFQRHMLSQIEEMYDSGQFDETFLREQQVPEIKNWIESMDGEYKNYGEYSTSHTFEWIEDGVETLLTQLLGLSPMKVFTLSFDRSEDEEIIVEDVRLDVSSYQEALDGDSVGPSTNLISEDAKSSSLPDGMSQQHATDHESKIGMNLKENNPSD
jgi:hypothetical protein